MLDDMARHAVTPFSWARAFRHTTLAGLTILLALAVFSDFIPAPFLSGRRWIAPMWLLGGVLTAFVVVQAYRNGGWKAVVGKQLFNTVLAICLGPPLLGLLCWMMLAMGAPWIYTRIAGVDFDQTHVMRTTYVRSARTCKYRLSGGPLEGRFPSHLCIDERLYRRHPEQPVSVRLSGQRSVLGMRIAAVAEAH
ncbi:hypothetical protein [Xanthomonas vesicatoria]|uniref:Uncharacterized protein n=1 Tax=Xanthomonas vesicatoria TaxID=56460 RepID=A0AAJ0J2B7_9XANT|nr:hypothetical protein [Xanthomonas vesicatoria]APO96731.1 hypothetical protein BI313_21010 [Xanthomonas vesicatoria]KHM98201.1 hypothetical protein OR61_01850 [Xanthomonas vesicatoria]KHM98334.1 hypothetical protein OR60_00310 [Xanthomonas vesicatoria]MCC8622585.1 hypothetical protein [Xanthomonas vesicatoria]MCC8694236.1 hypothetical protein [Xanthomonas vesicatoria]